LAASRGRNLFGLQPWTAGGWEIGSLVVHDEAIWRATGPVVATDTAPGTAGAPWAKVNLAGGVRWVSLDSDLPATAPAGEIYFVLQSALAGGGGALYYWDNANSQWLPLGGAGGGDAMDLSSGVPIVNVGVPIGCIQIWPVANPPPGWLICDGAAFSAGTYPELAQVLGSTTLPNLVGQFVRGAGTGHTIGTRRNWTTGMPRNVFVTTNSGEHNHWGGYAPDHNCWDRGTCGGSSVGNAGATNNNGWHTHGIVGGDAETAPSHTCLNYIIKAGDFATRVRI
jgi:microcystin-dependent protein